MTTSTNYLTSREQRALRSLVVFRFLTREQLQRFLFRGEQATPSSQEVMTRRTLNRLRGHRLIDYIPQGIGPSYVYFPTKSGELFMGKANNTPASRPKGQFLMRHQVSLGYVALALAEGAGEVVRWEADWQLAGRLEGRLNPDGFVVYKRGEEFVHAFLEMDLGTLSGEAWKGKVGRYMSYFNSGDYEGEFKLWPTVVTVTLHSHRANFLKGVTERMEPPDGMEFCFVSLPEMQKEGAGAEIYLIAGERGFHKVF